MKPTVASHPLTSKHYCMKIQFPIKSAKKATL